MSNPDEIREADQEKRLEELEAAEFGPPPPPPPPPPGDPIPIKAVSSSTFELPNKPENVLDDDISTRFSALGIGSWIKLDLGGIQEISRIDFQWYDKPPRSYNVDVTFDAIPKDYNHLADSATSSLAVPNIQAQNITIKLVNTSNPTRWLSIVGIKVFGKGGTPPPPPPPPGNNLDHFGTALGYARDTSKPLNNWYMTGASDPRFMEQNPKALANGWFTYPSLSQGRIEVMSVPGLSEDSFDTFWIDDLIKRGYAYKPIDSPDGKGDFGNVEVNVKYQNISEGSGSFEAHPETVYSLFRQTNDTKKVGKDKRVIAQCEAGSLHSNIYKGRCKFEKDVKHTEGYTQHDPSANIGYGSAGKTGFVHKSVFYRVADSTIPGGYAMKCEQYMSTDGLVGKKFKLLLEYLDNGKWGPSKGGHNSQCGCSEYVVLNFGRPTIGIRIDYMNSFEFKDWSITSIDPSKKLI